MKGPGYRLSDGVSNNITSNKLNGSHKQLSGPNIFYPTEKRKQLPPNNSKLILKSEDDISSFLIQAFSKGGGGKPFKQIQAVYKKVLAHMQKNSHAHTRVSAATLGQFLIAPVKSTDVDGGRVLGSFQETEETHCALHQITFGKDMSKKGGKYTDRVRVLPLDILKHVIENAYTSKDDVDGEDEDENKDVIDAGKELLHPIAIAQMMPQIFWSLVSHCRPSLDLGSNIQEYYFPVEDMLRQLLPHLDWSYLNHDGRQRILSEQAKENLQQEKMAKKSSNEWLLVTPTKDDEDKLIACISCDDQSMGCNLIKIYSSLLNRSKSEPLCVNWRQLANADAKYLHDKLVQECKKSEIEPPSLNSVKTWIFATWNFSVDEILNEIVGMDDNIHRLLEAMYSNTPKDLITYWGGHPNLLLEAMGNHPKNEDDLFHDHYQEKDAQHWINQAKVAIKMCPGLDDYFCQLKE